MTYNNTFSIELLSWSDKEGWNFLIMAWFTPEARTENINIHTYWNQSKLFETSWLIIYPGQLLSDQYFDEAWNTPEGRRPNTQIRWNSWIINAYAFNGYDGRPPSCNDTAILRISRALHWGVKSNVKVKHFSQDFFFKSVNVNDNLQGVSVSLSFSHYRFSSSLSQCAWFSQWLMLV